MNLSRGPYSAKKYRMLKSVPTDIEADIPIMQQPTDPPAQNFVAVASATEPPQL
jgi:hypothetical protein